MAPRFFPDNRYRHSGPVYIPPATCVASFVMTICILIKRLMDMTDPEKDDS